MRRQLVPQNATQATAYNPACRLLLYRLLPTGGAPARTDRAGIVHGLGSPRRAATTIAETLSLPDIAGCLIWIVSIKDSAARNQLLDGSPAASALDAECVSVAAMTAARRLEKLLRDDVRSQKQSSKTIPTFFETAWILDGSESYRVKLPYELALCRNLA